METPQMGILYSNNTMDDDVWLSVRLRDDTHNFDAL
jgi:hypothetical protein